MKACWVAEKEQLTKSWKAKFDVEKEQAIKDTKKKQWVCWRDIHSFSMY